MDDLLDIPGAVGASDSGSAYNIVDGSLPQENPPNLTPNFSPSLENLIPSSNSSNYTSQIPNSILPLPSVTNPVNTNSGYTSDSSLTSTLLGDVGTWGTSLLNAFVVNPQNAQTQETTALTNLGVSQATISQIFSYLLLGLGIYLLFSFAEEK